MATLIGVVSQVVGEVFAVASDGSRRPVSEGDRVYAGEQLLTGVSGAVAVTMANGQQLTLGRDSSIMLDAQMLAYRGEQQTPTAETPPAAPSDADLTDVERLQAAIEAGVDPTQEGEATAAGPGAGAGGAGGAGGGNSFVMLSEVGGALDPVIGFPTEGLPGGPEFPEGEVFAFADFSPELTVVFLDEQGSVVTGPGVVDEAALDGGESGGGQPGSNPGSNAERTSGTLIINSPDGIDRIEVLDAAGNWINVTGGGTVQGTYGVLVFDAAGNWTYTLTDNSLDHSNPNATGADDQLFDDFSVRVFDLDGDVSPTVPLTIAINDDGPSAGLERSGEGGEVVIDESAGLQPGSDDVAGPLAIFDSVASPSSDMRAYAQGSTPAVVADYAFGADEVGATAVYSLALTAGEGQQAQASGLSTSSGSPITLSIENGLVVGRDADGNAAFAIAIDPDSGVISVAQYQSLYHPDGSDANDSIDLGGLIRAVLTVTDGDGDQAVASADIGELIRFVDDGPTAAIDRVEGVRVSHDESAGLQNGIVTPTPGGDANDNDTNDESVVSLFASVSNTATDLSSPGYATSNGAVVDISGSSSGEDNEGATTVLSLEINGGDGTDSGLTTTEGQVIRLYLENGLIVGRVDGGDTGPGAAAFAIAIGQDGNISVAQYLSLHHPDTGSADDAVTLAGKVRAVVTVTDGDGDVDTAQVGIGGAIRFEDDGPTAVIERLEGVRVTHDESAGLQNASETPVPQGDALDNDTSNPDVIALFAGVDNVGTDLQGYATSGGPVVSTAGSSSGEDNEGATTVLSLEINGGDGTDSGLTTTDGQVIRLYMENGLIVGRVDGGDNGPGAAVFAVAIGEDGSLSVAQYMSLHHPDTDSRDEGVDLGGLVRAVVTVTDGDGDVDVAKVNIGGAIRFEDDAPTADIQVVEGARVTHDETPGLQNGTATPAPGSDANDNDTNNPSVIALFSSVTDAGTALAAGYATSNGPVVDISGSSTGEDQEGATTVLSLEIQDADSGLSAVDGSPIVLSVEGGLIVGRVEGGTYDGQAAFAVAIGQDGSLSIAQYIALQHPDTASHDEALNLSGKIRAVVTVTDGDGDVSVDSVGIGGAVRFEDDGPTASNVTATRVLDDEGLNGGINGGPGDVEGASTSSSGSLGYDAGADGLKSIVLTGPSTLGGESVTSTWDSDTNTLTISSSRGDLMTVVLTDLASGGYTVNLLKPLMHTVSGTEDNITLNVGYTITDGDGDTADGSLTVTINDDTPTLQVGELDLNSSVTFIGTDAGYSNSYGYYIKGENGTPLGGKVIWANVHDQSSGDTFDLGDLDPASTGFFIIPDGGANGGLSNGADITFQLVGGKWQTFLGGVPLTGADGANVLFSDAALNPGGSHLQDTGNAGNQNWEDKTDTSDYDYNDVSTSVTWGSTLQLQVDETSLGQDAGATATADFSGLFNVQPGADGLQSLGGLKYSLEITNPASGLVDTETGEDVVLCLEDGQIVGRVGDPDGEAVFTLTLSTDGKITLEQLRAIEHPTSDPDEAAFLGSGHVKLNLTVTDGDGDSVSSGLDIGKVISFRDDAPRISAGEVTSGELQVDETNLLVDKTIDYSGAFTSSYGADGAGSISYRLDISANGADSGLKDTASGQSIKLYLENGEVVGRVGGQNGAISFKVTVDAAGKVTLDQQLAIAHSPNTGPDQATSLSAADLVKLVATITDKDGDSNSASLNLGNAISFKDDAPTISAGQAQPGSLQVDESFLASDATRDFSGSFTHSFGSDGAGTLTYALNISAQGADTGLKDTASGQSIKLYLENGEVVGRVGGQNGAISFKVTVDAAGKVTLDQQLAILHTPDSGPDQATGLSAADLVKLVATITDKDGDSNSASLNLGNALSFKDDAPTISAGQAQVGSLQVDETDLTIDASRDFSGAFTSDYGADGAGSIGYALEVMAQGADSGLKDSASGQSVKLYLEHGEVVGRVGDQNGAISFKVTVDAAGKVTLDQQLAILHTPDSGPDQATGLSAADLVKLVATITDKDGDASSASLNLGNAISFRDDGPTTSNVTATRVLDDEGLNGGINGGPGDVEGASTSSSGSLGYDVGADGLKSIVLTGPSTLGGESVTSTWDSDTNTLTISSSRGDLMTVVLTDLASGAYTVNLLKPLMHTVSGTEDNITLNVGYTITDGDGDTADGSLTVTINDDTPTLQVGELDLNSSVTFIGTDAGYSNSYGYYIKGENGTPLGGKVIWANVHDQSSGDTFDLGDLDPASTGFFIIPDGGANGGLSNGADITFQLVGGKWQAFLGGVPLTGADGANVLFSDAALNPGGSHLQDTGNAGNQNWEDKTDTSDYDYNDVSTSVTWGSTLQLQVDESNLGQGAGATATADFSGLFNVQPGADGLQSLGGLKYSLEITNPASGLVDTETGEDVVLCLEDGQIVGRVGDPDGEAVFTLTVSTDGKITLEQLRAIEHPTSDPDEAAFLGSGHVKLNLTVTDGDDDSVSGGLDIGKVISFKDDAPSISAGQVGVASLQVDESFLGTDATANFSSAFTSSYGADGAGSISYRLDISASGADSGLKDTASGQSIKLYLENGEVVGRVGGQNGAISFKVTVDAAGKVTLDQQLAIAHSPNTGPDQATSLSAADLVKLVATITDKDGDSNSASLNLGNAISFKDDAPTISAGQAQAGSLQVDETTLAINTTTNFSGDFTSNYGADGAGTIGYALEVKAQGVDSGLKDTASGSDIKLYLENGEVVGRVGDQNGAISFKVTVNAAGHVTLDQVRAIIHSPDSGPDQATGLSAADLVKLVATITDKDGDSNSASLNLGKAISFKDDGPKITGFELQEGGRVYVDESVGTAGSSQDEDGYVAPNDEQGHGNVLGYARIQGSDLFNLAANGGSDGLDASRTRFALSLMSEGVDSGLDATAGGNILLYTDSDGNVLGKVGQDTIFKISVNTVDGSLTLAQYKAIAHGNTSSHDELALIKEGLVKLDVTVYDKDGDSDNASLDLGKVVGFEDDGPSVIQPDCAEVEENDGFTTQGVIQADYGSDGGGFDLSANAGLSDDGLFYTVVKENGVTTLTATVGDAQGDVFFVLKVYDDPNALGGGNNYQLTIVNARPVAIADFDLQAIAAGQPQASFLVQSGEGLAVTLTGSGLVNPSEQGVGVGGNNLINGTESLTMAFSATVYSAEVSVQKLSHGDQLSWTALDGNGQVVAAGTYDGQGSESSQFSFDLAGSSFTSGSAAALAGGFTTLIFASNDGDYRIQYITLEQQFLPPSLDLSFQVDVVDGDDDVVSTQLDVCFVNDEPTGGLVFDRVDEDGLPGGIPGGVQDDEGVATLVTGTLGYDYGDDGFGSFAWQPSGLPSVTSGGQAVEYQVSGNGQVLTAQIVGSHQPVFTVTLTNPTTGAFKFELHAPLDHPAPASGSVENNLDFQFGYQMVDGNGSTAQGALHISVDDDSPAQPKDIAKSASEPQGIHTNLMVVLDMSGSMDDSPSGVSGFSSKLALAKDAVQRLIDSYDNLGDVMVRIVTFANTASAVGDVWMTASDAKTWLTNLANNAGNGATNYDDALIKAMNAYDASGKLTGAGVQNVSYFLSDGQPTLSNSNPGSNNNGSQYNPSLGDGIDSTEEAAWIAFLNAKDIKSYALGMGLGSDLDKTLLNPIAYDGKAGVNTDGILVSNLNQLNDTLQGTVTGTVISGNLINEGSNGFGADGPGVLPVAAITHNGVTYTSASAAYDAASHTLTFTTAGGGSFSVNLLTGAYTYNFNGNVAEDVTDTIRYTLIDRDGDAATAELKLTITDSSEVHAYDNYNQAIVGQEWITATPETRVLADFSSTSNPASSGGSYNPWVFDTVDSFLPFGDERTVVTTNDFVNVAADKWGVSNIATNNTSGSSGVNGVRVEGEQLQLRDTNSAGDVSTKAITPSFQIAEGLTGTLSFTVNQAAVGSGDSFAWKLYSLSDDNVWGEVSDVQSENLGTTISLLNLAGGTYRVYFEANDRSSSNQNRNSSQYRVTIDNITLVTLAAAVLVDTATAVAGNVLTDSNNYLASDHPWGAVDSKGSEGAVLSVLDNGNFVAVGTSKTLIGQWGTLLIQGDGSYTYTPEPDYSNLGKEDVFTYQLTQPDGDVSTANLVVGIGAGTAVQPNVLMGNEGLGDTLLGSEASDVLLGLSGNDTLYGMGGNDRLEGGAGNDTLVGGKGDDILIGGSGNDTFVWTADDRGGNYHDIVKDFGNGDDKLDLSQLLQGIEGPASADVLTQYLSFDFVSEPGNTVINVASAGNASVDQTITLENTILSGGNAAEVIQGMLDHNQLIA